MATMLVRLKPFDPRRGNVLQRFTYAGIKFHEARGWYRVEPDVAAYLRTVHQRPEDPHTPLAFDVCTDEQARVLELRDKEAATPRKAATDDIELSPARLDGAVMPPRRVAVEDAPPGRADGTAATPRRAAAEDAPPGRTDGAASPPRKAATDDVPVSTVRTERTAPPVGPSEPLRDDRRPAPTAEAPEPARDDRRPTTAPAPRKDRP